MRDIQSAQIRGVLSVSPILVGALLAGAFFATPARAAGGADVVDDAFAETAKVCHVESWLVVAEQGGTLSHLGIGCTTKAVPRLELDAVVERQSDTNEHYAFQPGLKYTLLARPGALAIGLSGTAVLDHQGRVDGIAINGPITFVRGRFTLINIDIGWQLTRDRYGPDRGQLTWGGQIEQTIAPHLVLIGEVFGVGAQTPGLQGGIRWSPGPQRVDIDLRGSHQAGLAGTALTLGATVRI